MEIILDSSLELGEMSAGFRKGGMTLAAPWQDLGMEENSNSSYQKERECFFGIFFDPEKWEPRSLFIDLGWPSATCSGARLILGLAPLRVASDQTLAMCHYERREF